MNLNFDTDIKLIGNKITTVIDFTNDEIDKLKEKLSSVCDVIDIYSITSDYINKNQPQGIYLIYNKNNKYTLYINTIPYIEYRYYLNNIISKLGKFDKIKFYLNIEDFFNDINNIKKFLLEFDDDHKSKYRKFDVTKPFDLDISVSGFDSQISSLLNDDYGFGISFTDSRICVKDIDADNFNFDNAIKRLNKIMLLCMNCIGAELSDKNLDKLLKINNDFKNTFNNFNNIKTIREMFPKFTVDLDNTETTCQIYILEYNKLLYKIYLQGLKDSSINFDTDNRRLQIKDLDKSDLYLYGLDLVNCKLKNSKVDNCDVYAGEFDNVKLTNSNSYSYLNIKNSKIIDTYISVNTNCKDCEVFGQHGKFAGILDGKSSKIFDTSIVKSTANIADEVYKNNLLEI